MVARLGRRNLGADGMETNGTDTTQLGGASGVERWERAGRIKGCKLCSLWRLRWSGGPGGQAQEGVTEFAPDGPGAVWPEWIGGACWPGAGAGG